ncbi:thiamine biosynthesis lipoprotein [Roseivivax lentus]|uniref:FAD:protein FMN transferase n=1 Tax=Roseivivax lentus TaxID=633194 RepID=A0A1N7P3V5_9RHOB|nr:FAD:protein FMN transferase [Roseivivax lentus]SIT05119.1 thiamine biosynthesis lipoprotein [Roseivivax lentus]
MTRSFTQTRRGALGLLGASLALPAAAFAGPPVEVVSGAAFGSSWRAVAAPALRSADLRPLFEALFAEIDAALSPWRPESAISRFNAAEAGEPNADPALIEVTRAAMRLARLSDGAFDPTVGPLVAQWGFGPIRGGGVPGWRDISVGASGVGKTRGDLTLDLCGIAKGWALDRVAQHARALGRTDLLLELGGEFIALGRHPDGRDWHLAVEPPVPGGPIPARLRVPDGHAVATSGTRAQGYVVDGRLYSHLIDPKTQSPVDGALRSVTVAAEDAMSADGWATALFAAGDVAGPELAASRGIAALFLFEESGGPGRVTTGHMPELLL